MSATKRKYVAALILFGTCGFLATWYNSRLGVSDVRLVQDASPDVFSTDASENGYRISGHRSTSIIKELSSSLKDFKATDRKMLSNHLRTAEGVLQTETSVEEESYDFEEEQLKRQEHLEKACSRLGISRTLPPVSWETTVHFLASDKFKFIFCFVPKISCTTWKEIMAKLYHLDRNPLQMVPKAIKGVQAKRKWKVLKLSDIGNPEKVKKRWKTYNKVMFTREPLERALSAYLDKFVYGKTSFERQFGGAIVKQYRDKHISKVKFPLKEKIRFDEFIRFITDKGPNAPMTQQTDHWLPVSRITSPCRFKYDFLGHYETLQYDAPYVIKHFNLSRYVTFPEVHSSRSHEKLINAYKDIPQDLIYRLVDYYRTDYELFGYSANATLDIIFNGRNREKR
ncbi:carbohydrate sulfotransferase 14-like isoform X1 [Lytechinus pictus]|uniref:carbohydrate sulfotransferase 14-like isoform X1 n=1 Tax=Lytechinus pictus TaxID=7653 RepID=UPI0030B9C3DF